MARPLSDDKREAILNAATRVIAAQGLSAPTATIAREAGVANGSLFTYFETKADLLNVLYVALKSEMTSASSTGIDQLADNRQALWSAWSGWLEWASSNPEKRRTLTLLGTSDEITPQSHRAGQNAMSPLAQLVDRCRSGGPMADVSLAFVATLLSATAEATIDFIRSDPQHAADHSRRGFDAVWRMIA